MDQARLLIIDDVDIQAPRVRQAELMWFYGELVGLTPRSDPCDSDVVLRFRSERFELRIGLVEQVEVDSVDCRIHCQVQSLDDVARLLEDRRYPFEWITGISATDRAITLLDPAGYRVLLRRLWPVQF